MDESFIGTITRDGRRTGQFYAGAVEFDQSSFCGHSGSNNSPRPPKTLPSEASYLPPRRRISPSASPSTHRETTEPTRNDRLIITTTALISNIYVRLRSRSRSFLFKSFQRVSKRSSFRCESGGSKIRVFNLTSCEVASF